MNQSDARRVENIEQRGAGGNVPPAGYQLHSNGPVAQPQQQPQPVQAQRQKPSEQWEERKAPELFSFSGRGDYVEGTLIQAGEIVIADKQTGRPKKVTQYTFRDSDGNATKIIGTWDINQKLGPRDIGRNVRVTLIGENPNVQKNGNHMREFEVLLSPRNKEQAKFADGTEITDEDIPF